MDITKVLSLIFGAIGLFGGVAIFFNGARKDSIIAVLTKENLTLKDYNGTLEGRASRAEADRDGYKSRYESELEHTKQLGELAQGSPQLILLTKEFHNLNKTNQQILQTLQSSKTTLAKNTRQARKATQQVREDLRNTP